MAIAPVEPWKTAEPNEKATVLQLGTVQETEAKSKLSDPSFGYVGQLGSFVAARESQALALMVVHNFPDTQTSGFGADRLYVVQTLPKVVERLILMTTDPGDVVLDPTCGSGTTAFVA